MIHIDHFSFWLTPTHKISLVSFNVVFSGSSYSNKCVLMGFLSCPCQQFPLCILLYIVQGQCIKLLVFSECSIRRITIYVVLVMMI